jgi:hypothetical protein
VTQPLFLKKIPQFFYIATQGDLAMFGYRLAMKILYMKTFGDEK